MSARLDSDLSAPKRYRGRLAPTPTGDIHVGHARTFVAAWRRAADAGGEMVLRIEDLDPLRCRAEYTARAIEDLEWLGVKWSEGPVYQSELRPPPGTGGDGASPAGVVWRFRVPDGEAVCFEDARYGAQSFTAGVDFGDFIVWRKDDVPAYELAVVADDIAMGITDVVRGEDLLKSTARQLLVYRALGATPPSWCHLPLVRDSDGHRLAKRHRALSVRELRARGYMPEEVLALARDCDSTRLA